MRGALAVLGGSIGQKAIGLVSLVVLARVLPLGDFAVVAFAAAFATFFTAVSDLGVDPIATRELAARPGEEGAVLGAALGAKAVATAVTLVVAVAAASILFDGDYRLGALVSLLAVVAVLPSTAALVLTARVRPTGPIVIRLCGAVVAAVVACACALAGGDGVTVVAAQSGAGLVTAVALWLHARRVAPVTLVFDRAAGRALLAESLPLAAATVAVVVFARIDQMLLAALAPAAEVARYGAAVRLVDALNFLPIAIATVVLPAISQLDAGDTGRRHQLAERGFRYQAAVVLPVAALGTAVGSELASSVLGDRYAEVGTPLALLLWAHGFAFAWLLSRQVLVASRRVGTLASMAIGAAAVNVVLNLWWIPDHGATGAAAASLVSYGVPFAVGLVLPRARPEVSLALLSSARPLVAAAVIAVVLALLDRGGAATPLLLAAFAVVAPVALAVTGSLRRDDVADLVAAVRGRVTTGVPPS